MLWPPPISTVAPTPVPTQPKQLIQTEKVVKINPFMDTFKDTMMCSAGISFLKAKS